MLQRTSWGRGTAVTVVSCVFQHTNLPKSGALQSTPTMFMAQLCLYCCQSICKCPIRVDGFFCGWRDPSLSPRWSSFAPGCFALTCGKHLTYSDFICASWQTKCFKTIHLGFYVFCLVFGFWFFFFGKSIGRIGFFFFFFPDILSVWNRRVRWTQVLMAEKVAQRHRVPQRWHREQNKTERWFPMAVLLSGFVLLTPSSLKRSLLFLSPSNYTL